MNIDKIHIEISKLEAKLTLSKQEMAKLEIALDTYKNALKLLSEDVEEHPKEQQVLKSVTKSEFRTSRRKICTGFTRQVYLYLKEKNQPLRPKNICAALNINKSTISPILIGGAKRGLIKRDDGLYSITEEGIKLLEMTKDEQPNQGKLSLVS